MVWILVSDCLLCLVWLSICVIGLMIVVFSVVFVVLVVDCMCMFLVCVDLISMVLLVVVNLVVGVCFGVGRSVLVLLVVCGMFSFFSIVL